MSASDNEFEPIVLFNGYTKVENDEIYSNCTCTLLKGTPNIIIDTMNAWDGEKITEALKKNNLKCEDINYVICTHGHPDHVGCNYLFPAATHIVGFNICHRDKYAENDFRSGKEYRINDKIKIVPTPGHTLQDITVIIESAKGIFAVTGDLFENEEDLKDDEIWQGAGSDSEELQEVNREKILKLADYIIPGHGPMFKVPDLYKANL